MSKNQMMVAISKNLGIARNAIPSIGKRLLPDKFFSLIIQLRSSFSVFVCIRLFKELLGFFVLSVSATINLADT